MLPDTGVDNDTAVQNPAHPTGQNRGKGETFPPIESRHPSPANLCEPARDKLGAHCFGAHGPRSSRPFRENHGEQAQPNHYLKTRALNSTRRYSSRGLRPQMNLGNGLLRCPTQDTDFDSGQMDPSSAPASGRTPVPMPYRSPQIDTPCRRRSFPPWRGQQNTQGATTSTSSPGPYPGPTAMGGDTVSFTGPTRQSAQ